jgi:hypothetical protein
MAYVRLAVQPVPLDLTYNSDVGNYNNIVRRCNRASKRDRRE